MLSLRLLSLFCVLWICGYVTAVPAPPNYCNGQPDGDYHHPASCKEHIKCSNGMAVVFDCPAMLVWNDNKKECDYISDKPSCNIHFSCAGKSDGNHPNPNDCTKFYMCSNGHPWAMDCPANTHFDAAKKVCNHSADAGCS